MSDFTGLAIAGRIATPSDSDWDEARPPGTSPPTSAPRRSPSSRAPRTSPRRSASPPRTACASPARGPATAPSRLAGSLEGAILVKTERMRGIEVDPEAQTARVEAGVLVAELSAAAQKHGLSSMPGSSPDVGVIGFTLGGGLSWLGRHYGFACNRVRAIELVTADGEQRTVDAENEPDLFWALRGGGGGYALVTALHLNLVPIGEIYAGALVFPAELGAEAVRAYRDWAAGVPDERHLGRPLHHPAADPRRARADPRPAAADDRRRLHRQPGGGRGDRRAAARARRDDHGHLGPNPRRGPLPHPHGPGEPGAGPGRG